MEAQSHKTTKVLGTLAVFFTAVSGIVLLVQYLESRELNKLQKEIAILELKKKRAETTKNEGDRNTA